MMKSNIIREKRLDKGLSANKVAQIIGISSRQFLRIEHADFTTINLNTVDKISKVLNIDIADLVHYFVENKH